MKRNRAIHAKGRWHYAPGTYSTYRTPCGRNYVAGLVITDTCPVTCGNCKRVKAGSQQRNPQ